MDLLRIAGFAHQLVANAQLPAWAFEPEEFLRHFGVPHEEYVAVVSLLSPDQAQLLDATLSINPEAAVLWILHMTEIS